MNLGAFSISLTVANLAASRSFYEKLGFAKAGGNADQGWLVLRGGDTTIGLFHGMFERNMLTFNPGWGPQATPLPPGFDDVRRIQKHLQAGGITLDQTTDPAGTGPGYITFADPDGNPILIDQHV